ncbi:hypothetical protein CANINC_003082 [Pichia inconspicua]|uniref:CNNM transmembrane domain-containing protein n=1 Tax=Pichia inconspicua TaxID=52247 RepID=A0A4T0WZJ8_9ASCO|nr:hypothetical protein CANINC_003082 [[Candida] inconspicua]
MPRSTYHYKIAKAFLALLPTVSNAIPIELNPIKRLVSNDAVTAQKLTPLTETEFYIYGITSACLVLLGGVFAGLTLGLMGQDEIYLKVIASSGTEKEKVAANKVLKLLDRGKHWLLVTLLLSNVITNETLPVILDRLLGGGFAAVFSSTVAIVIFGEIIPQSICVRYGLELGAFFSPYVLCLMYFMYPVAYPIAKLLDYILGQDHGTLYRKSGLKTLVNLHHTMGTERLNIDEVTIISAVLDLKAKPVSEIMTPIEKVYALPSDRILDEDTIEEIFDAGFSRIPIYYPGEPHNYVGMLLVRILISYDPEDALPISSFPLATLPETSLNTSCLNILNYFQEGKSHMVVVSENPGSDTGARGVLTLEDVIEELIGEEIVDETDVYVDVNKNIKRAVPGPFSKRNVTSYLHKLYKTVSGERERSISSHESRSNSLPNAYIKKEAYKNSLPKPLPKNINMIPSNLAADPLKTKNAHITIKKQPTLSSPAQKTTDVEKFKKTEERRSLSPALENSAGYGTNLVPEAPQVMDSEASAFVQGVYDNASRHSVKCNDLEDCEPNHNIRGAKKVLLGSSYGIPVPKIHDEQRLSKFNDDSSSSEADNGILVEDNIVSLKGVNKTIIHDGTWTGTDGSNRSST